MLLKIRRGNKKTRNAGSAEFREVYAAWSGFIWTSVLLFLAEQQHRVEVSFMCCINH